MKISTLTWEEKDCTNNSYVVLQAVAVLVVLKNDATTRKLVEYIIECALVLVYLNTSAGASEMGHNNHCEEFLVAQPLNC
jgi:hypothetical protein